MTDLARARAELQRRIESCDRVLAHTQKQIDATDQERTQLAARQLEEQGLRAELCELLSLIPDEEPA